MFVVLFNSSFIAKVNGMLMPRYFSSFITYFLQRYVKLYEIIYGMARFYGKRMDVN